MPSGGSSDGGCFRTMMLLGALVMAGFASPAESQQTMMRPTDAAAKRIGSSEAEQVRQLVASAVESVDTRRWDSLRDALSESVFVDYTSLFGGQPRAYAADELIDNWRQLLEPLSGTKHVLGPIVIEGDERMVRATCPVHIYHFLSGAPGGEEWGVIGRFAFTLEKRGNTWRIQSLVLSAQSQEGNTRLLVEAFAEANQEPQSESRSAIATNHTP